MTNLALFRTAVETVVTALVPASDGTALAYRFIDDLVEERGNGQHRELIWRMAKNARLAAEHEEQNDWTVALELFIHRTPPGRPDRTYRAFCDAVEAEATDIELAFSRMGGAQFNPTSVGAVLDGFVIAEREPERPAGAGGVPRYRVAVVTFNFRVLVQENG